MQNTTSNYLYMVLVLYVKQITDNRLLLGYLMIILCVGIMFDNHTESLNKVVGGRVLFLFVLPPSLY